MEFTYIDGDMNGEGKLTWDGGCETLQFVHGVKEGPATIKRADGAFEEFVYNDQGLRDGPATQQLHNGDRLEFSYHNGKKMGAMTYHFQDGSVERSFYDENGVQSGPTQLIWANGARREGHKVHGKWEGQVFYQYAEGPRKGKRDLETWSNGEMVSSQKIYEQGDTINDWDDLKKLQVLGASENNSSSPDKDVYYDCISQND